MDVSVEFQKYLSLNDIKEIMSMDDKFKQIEKENKEFLQILDKNLTQMKKKSLKKIAKEIKKYKKDWENEYNKDQITNNSKGFNLKLKNLKSIDKILNVIPSVNQQRNQVSKPSSPSEPSQPSQPSSDSNKNSFNNKPIKPNEKTLKKIKDCLNKFEMKLNPDSISYLVSNVLNNEDLKLTLLYKLSKKSLKFKTEKFNEKTKDKKKILVLCISNNKLEFGGYVETGWDTNDSNYNKNCIFSLSNKTIHYQIKKISENCLETQEKSGPSFGLNDLVIGDNCNKMETCSSNLGELFEFSGNNPKTYLAGSEKFNLSDCLVFSLKPSS